MDNYIVKIGDTCEAVEINPGELLSELQAVVGGYIEVVPLTRDFVMIVNEDGILMELPLNEKASAIFGFYIYGTAAIIYKNLKPLDRNVAEVIAMFTNCDKNTQKNIYEEVMKNGVTL